MPVRLWGPRPLDDDVEEPAWLNSYPGAREALGKLVGMGRVQNRLLSGLELLRADVLGSAKPKVVLDTPLSTTLPTKAQVYAAAKSFDTAAQKARDVLAPFASAPGVLDGPVDQRWRSGSRTPHPLSQVVFYLEAVQGTMQYLRTLMRYKGLRDVLKAYITVHAYDFAKDRYHDDLVADLITALLMNGQRSEIRENGWIEIEDQALETGPNEVETPSLVNGASHGAEGRFLSGTSRASVSSSLSDDECTTVRRDRARYRVAYPRRRRARDSSSITNSISCLSSILSDDKSTTVRR